MSFPATVDANYAWPGHKNHSVGPFVNGSDLYCVLKWTTEVGGNAFHVRVFRSTDGGETWSAQDTTNEPQNNVNEYFAVAAFQSGTSIYVTYQAALTGTLAVRPFSLATNTWGTAVTGGPITNTNPVAGSPPCFLARRSDASYVIFYNGTAEKVMGVNYARVKVSYYNGSWNGPYDVVGSANSPPANTLPGTQIDYNSRVALLGSSDRFHMFWTVSTGGLRHRTFLSGNTFTTGQDVDTTVLHASPYACGIPVAYVDGADTKLVVPYGDSDNSLAVARATSADSPSWSSQTVSATTVSNPDVSLSNPAAVAVDGTIVYAFWVDELDLDIWRDNDQGSGSWQTDVLWKVADTRGINIGIFSYQGADYIGVLYNDTSTVKFDRYLLRAAKRVPPLRVLMPSVHPAWRD